MEEQITRSGVMQQVMAQLRKVAPTEVLVLLLGETGTGKGWAAQRLHEWSGRPEPLVSVNCGAIPAGLVERELFGHEQGAFTGADSSKAGHIEAAGEGTLFLDEIDTLPLEDQVSLLHVLEERQFTRVGSTHRLHVRARIVAATNSNLEAMVAQGRFREDLFYRLHGVRLRLPPLRERREEILPLAESFVAQQAARMGIAPPDLSPEAIAYLESQEWRGNVRQLKSFLEQAMVFSSGPTLVLYEGMRDDTLPEAEALRRCLETIERRRLCQALERTGWVIKGPQGAAAHLGLPESTLRHRMKKLDIVRPGAAARSGTSTVPAKRSR